MHKRYGDNTSKESTRADKLAAESDCYGAAIWRLIINAVEQLANTLPSGPVNLPGRAGDLLNRDPLDLIERNLVAGAIVKLGGARASCTAIAHDITDDLGIHEIISRRRSLCVGPWKMSTHVFVLQGDRALLRCREATN